MLLLEAPRVLLLETPRVLLLESEHSNLLRVLLLVEKHLGIVPSKMHRVLLFVV